MALSLSYPPYVTTTYFNFSIPPTIIHRDGSASGWNPPISTEKMFLDYFFKGYTLRGIPHEEFSKNSGDIRAIKAISRIFYSHSEQYDEYFDKMTQLFFGSHIVIEDDGALVNRLKRLTGALSVEEGGWRLRSSSHYGFGSMDRKKGGVVPSTELEAKKHHVEPQYEIQGPILKALLFGKVCLPLSDKGEWVFGRAASAEEMLKGRCRWVTWLQTEWAPDGESLFSLNFWKHRVFSFALYRSRMFLGFSNPNVGPYGYGLPDTKPLCIERSTRLS